MMITEDLIIKESGQYDPEVIQRLVLRNLGVRRIQSLDRCFSLVQLDLSNNEIGVMEGLDSLVSLERLDLSFNKIRKIENLQHLTKLQYLDLRANSIASVNDMMEIQILSELRTLFLKGVDGDNPNPACTHPSYITIVMRTLPQLEIIDGGHLQVNEAFESLEDHLKTIQADRTAAKTPPLEPWFQADELDAEVNIGTEPSDLEVFINSSKEFKDVVVAQDRIEEMLREDCAHVMRKAQSAISKATKTS